MPVAAPILGSKPDFQELTRDLRAQVDLALAAAMELGADCPANLREAMAYSLLAPGKRLRPLLVLMAAEACGYEGEGTNHSALAAACAVEMVHTYSLIHDDLPAMDDDDLRRGRPTCHKVYGEATAILAGDALLALAFETLACGVQPPEVAARCCAELGRAAGPTALVGGQADDLAAEATGGDLSSLEAIHRRKTGALFLASLRMGGLVARADAKGLAALEDYGRRLGLAFQIVDDLLDARGNAAALGKNANHDSERGKLTFPSLLGIEESSRRASRLIEEAIAAIEGFGSGGGRLEALARFVAERNR